MTTFEERLQRLDPASGNRTTAAQPAPVVTTGEAKTGLLRHIIMLPVALAMGAGAVLAGGIIQVVVIDGGMTPSTSIPPELGLASFVIAFVLSLLFDKLSGKGHLGPVFVTVGFIAMMWGEWRLAEEFPTLWATLYKGEYLQPAIQMAGL